MIRRALILLLLTAAAASADWEPVGPGVSYRHYAGEKTDVHVVRVDLTNEEIRVIATRESERGLRVSDYARKNKALIAVNADYFDQKMKPVGLAIGPCGQWEGTKDTEREGVVAIGDGRARIDAQKAVMDPPEDWVGAAVSGWPLIVNECAALTAKELPGSDAFTRAPHPRSAAGVSKDGKTLYLVVADGRREGVPGMTLAELAEFMRNELDVCSAMNFDGGGSTAMWVGDHVVNKPSDGTERKVSNHLAVVLQHDYDGCGISKASQ